MRSAIGNKKLLEFNCDGQPINGASKDTVSIAFEEALKNVLALGSTGSGKTVGVALPALEGFIENDIGGLVVDVKGEIRNAIDNNWGLDSDRFYWIGTHANARSVNILSGFSANEFSDFLRSATNIEKKADNKIFAERGLEMVEFIFRTAYAIDNKAPTLTKIKRWLENPDEMVETLHDRIGNCTSLPKRFKPVINEMQALQNGSNNYHLLRITDYFSSNGNEETLHEQIGYARANIVPYLKKFTQNEAINDTICANSPLNLRDAIYNQDKIVVLDIPTRNSAACLAQKLIRSHFQDVVYNEKQGRDYSPNKRTFTLADDYQQIVSFDDYIDDNHWLDICRGLDHSVIGLTQSLSSLKAEVQNNPHRVMTLIQNFRTKIMLPTSDRATLNYVRTLTNKSISPQNKSGIGFGKDPERDDPCFAIKRLLYPDQKGQGILYKGSVRNGKSQSFLGPIRTGSVPGNKRMGRFINQDSSTAKQGSINRRQNGNSSEEIENPYVNIVLNQMSQNKKQSSSKETLVEAAKRHQTDAIDRTLYPKRVRVEAAKRYQTDQKASARNGSDQIDLIENLFKGRSRR